MGTLLLDDPSVTRVSWIMMMTTRTKLPNKTNLGKTVSLLIKRMV